MSHEKMSYYAEKNEGGPFGEFFFEKSLTMPKQIEREDPLVSPGIVCYGEKGKPWANRYNLKFGRTFGRTISVTSGVSKKTLTKKAMTIVDS